MARLPGPEDVQRTPLAVTRRIVEAPVDQSGGQMVRVADAASELLGRVRDAQIEAEVRAADSRYALDLDRARRELEADNDYTTYEQRFQQKAQELRNTYAERLSSPAHRRLWTQRADAQAAQGTVQVRDLARRKSIEGAVSGVVQLGAAAQEIIDDDGAPESLQVSQLQSYAHMVRSNVSRGIIPADDGERMVATMEQYYRTRAEQRSLVAGAQRAADAVFADPRLVTLDDKLGWVRQNVPEGKARAAAEDEVAQRFQRQRVAREESQEQDRIAFMRAENGDGTLDGATRARIEQEQPDFIQQRREYRRSLWRQGVADVETARREAQLQSQSATDGLIADALNDPAKLRRLMEATPEQLQRITARLEPDDAVRLGQFRARALGRGGGDDAQAQLVEKVFSDLYSRAEPQAVLMLDGEFGGTKGKGEVNKAQLRRYLLGNAREFVTRYGRAPSEQELTTIVNRGFEQQRTRNEYGQSFQYRFGRPPPLPLTAEEQKPPR
ncbi:MAG: hypothetical protein EBR82_08000 [Caulobacteraceae bacterium]|nr:hypothetical protein [Caulobacteraceae bacterium]